jgi:hypothetical protein
MGNRPLNIEDMILFAKEMGGGMHFDGVHQQAPEFKMEMY